MFVVILWNIFSFGGGEGEFDIKGFVKCVKQTGYTGPWAVEVFSAELVGLPLDELNRRAFATTMAQFRE